jgi:phosphoribosylformylglycinamidine synthase
MVAGLTGGSVPQVDPARARAAFAAIHRAIREGYVRACHDLSEGGLAVAVAEMAFAGSFGARVYLAQLPNRLDHAQFADHPEFINLALLFSESNTRFLCEVPQDQVLHFEHCVGSVPHAAIGEVTAIQRVQIVHVHPDNPDHVVDLTIEELKEAWQRPLRW